MSVFLRTGQCSVCKESYKVKDFKFFKADVKGGRCPKCAEEYRKGELYEQMEEKRRWDLTKKEDKRRWNKEHKYKIEKSQKEFEQKERYLQNQEKVLKMMCNMMDYMISDRPQGEMKSLRGPNTDSSDSELDLD